MKVAWCLAVILGMTATTRADQKIQGMTPGFATEASACQIELRGMTRVITGATELAATLSGAESAAAAEPRRGPAATARLREELD